MTETPCVSERVDLVAQCPRVDDDAVADDAELALAHHAGGQQRQLIGVVADDQGVAGVVAALEAHDDVGALRQPVDDLAFALVAPLGADHDHVRHAGPLHTTRPQTQAPGPSLNFSAAVIAEICGLASASALIGRPSPA